MLQQGADLTSGGTQGIEMTNALAVVAHHDDHLLWMGGTLQQTMAAGWNWTLVVMCLHNNSAKQSFFTQFCSAFKITDCHCFNFEDYQGPADFCRNQKNAMATALQQIVSGRAFDWVFTHSRRQEQEYGLHANHIEVQETVTSLVKSKSIAVSKGTAYFCYRAIYGAAGTPTVADNQHATHYCQSTYPEQHLKVDWCEKVPDQRSLYELGFPCPMPEAFEGDCLQLPCPPFRS